MKKYLPFLILSLFICLIAISTYKLNKAQEIGQKKPFFDEKNQEMSSNLKKIEISLPDFSLGDLFNENQKFTKKDLLGKYSIINFFASWCTTCIAEHNILLKLSNQENINLYGVAWRDIDKNTKKFLKKNGNPFKQTLKDSKATFGNIINLQAVPETIIINPKGVIIARYQGILEDSSIFEIKRIIKKD